MNRNAESRFAINPTNINISRSAFDRSHSLKTTFDCGQLVPICVDEVLPGDTWSIQTSKIVRLQTLINPLMDNLFLDTYWFFVPNRLLWDHWQQFCGENTESAWIPETEYSVPQLIAPTSGGFLSGSLADYMGVPIGVPSLHVSALPFRAYAKVVNDWFVDENLDDPVVMLTDDANQFGRTTAPDTTYDPVATNLQVVYGNKPFVVAKYHDYFTSCLPGPLKGPVVTVGAVEASKVPIITSTDVYGVSGNPGLTFGKINGSEQENGNFALFYHKGSDGEALRQSSTAGSYAGYTTVPNNLYADIGNSSFGINIGDLRTAFQIQRFFERASRGGTRYIEILKSFFGVTSPDSRLQRSEYLGGNRIPIMIQQVIQQSQTTEDSPQGNVAGLSVTTDTHSEFTHSFTEHGFILGLAVVRYKHSYQNGLNRMWSRKTKFDYYWPVFANLSEQAVKNREIFANGSENGEEPDINDEVFGYQEAWAEYRYHPDTITGEMRSDAPLSLDSWHLGDDYSSLPLLSSSWLRENPSNVDRVIAVSSRVSNQFFGDFYFRCKVVRPMPLYSIPGLIDHN